MDLIVELQPEVQERLESVARELSMEPSAYASRLIEAALPKHLSDRQRHLLEMLEQWDEEDKTDDPAVISERIAEWEEFKRSINEHHGSDRLVYP
jgi:hypothetical protein